MTSLFPQAVSSARGAPQFSPVRGRAGCSQHQRPSAVGATQVTSMPHRFLPRYECRDPLHGAPPPPIPAPANSEPGTPGTGNRLPPRQQPSVHAAIPCTNNPPPDRNSYPFHSAHTASPCKRLPSRRYPVVSPNRIPIPGRPRSHVLSDRSGRNSTHAFLLQSAQSLSTPLFHKKLVRLTSTIRSPAQGRPATCR